MKRVLTVLALAVGLMATAHPAQAQFAYAYAGNPTTACFGPGLGINIATGQLFSCSTSVAWTAIPYAGQTFNDGEFTVPPGACAWGSSGGTVTSNGLAVAGNIAVNQLTTTTATETATLVCAIVVPTRLTTGKGITVTNVVLRYGNSTGAIATCGTPTIGTQTAPLPISGETPASATLVTAGGTLAVLPLVGSCNTTAVTAGQIYSERVALGTPLAYNTDYRMVYFTQVFTGPASASFTIYTAGIDVHYTITAN